jgi:hypothetical protein
MLVSWYDYIHGTLLCADLGGRPFQSVGPKPLA